jgi:exocyst complex component 6
LIFRSSHCRKEDDEKLMGLSESVHPVRRAELAFSLLGRADEFVSYYETNRFGEVMIGGGDVKEGEAKAEKRSPLSSLTGDDISVGTDRIFFTKTLPHLGASVVGFSAVEAALELGNFVDEDDEKTRKVSAFKVGGASTSSAVATTSVSVLSSASRFRESSERYERSLIYELGSLVRGRATRASLPELVRSSAL